MTWLGLELGTGGEEVKVMRLTGGLWWDGLAVVSTW